MATKIAKNLKKAALNYDLYLLVIPAIVYYIIFYYWPMYGVQIAFRNFIPTLGITHSPWVGLLHFRKFFSSFFFSKLLMNTIGLSLYSLIAGFPVPIILSLMINEIKSRNLNKLFQMGTYAPHFISTVVLVSMMILFTSPQTGIINTLLGGIGVDPINFMAEPKWFKTIYVLSGIWQNAGWNSIIYIAALSNIDIQLYEAAKIDGATAWQCIKHINIPGILPTIVILFILNSGQIMNVGFEKVFLMQNSLNMSASDVISTYVYRIGLIGGQFSFSSAVGLFNSVINFILLIFVNRVANRINETSLW
jgi:putative aldouronate transport system permease protein